MTEEEGGQADRGLSSAIYQRLRNLIIKHEIPAGQRLDTRRLAEAFAVSSGPVRDAINRLTGEALVQHVASRGYFVRPISEVDLIEAHEMIFMVLRHAVLFPRRPFETVGLQMAAAQRVAGVLPDAAEEIVKQYTFFKETLFERIAGLSGNATAVAFTRHCLDRTHYVRTRDLLDPLHLEAVGGLMEELLQNLTIGERERALLVLETLLDRKLPRLSVLVAQIENQILAQDLLFGDLDD
ncbi:GntR family transcriptional regulator [Chelatococcus asaccharovorans]|uniref:DNA-binding GntR family transcriptional regulator n=1 Tax=Chelatococcus asaccharovorans TaxID=28210 RepID=A0A2V3U9S1_9HYPH|nr:GntR family transcriptional regulator [Chelatococcus asaccharovorans]MBS7705576.1 GntR family transcriptional regulator [Chelatococcus asaccharovorans]PXW60014.1 DNA-binding GntR family transcriptional regulator [Chelatococcus asaccharovorans]